MTLSVTQDKENESLNDSEELTGIVVENERDVTQINTQAF
jgi:hypothetical protein